MSRPLNNEPSFIEAASQRRPFSVEGHTFSAAPAEPGLHITATPIGNLGDITLRALQTLAGVDVILCEDTRVTRKLTQRYGITTPLQPYHEHNAAKVRPGILSRLEEGAAIALVSDAGTPLISDPGYKLVREAREQGLRIHAVPGASAVLAGLSIAGLPSDSFLFAGFLPAKSGERTRRLADLAEVPATVILFEAPQRLLATLSAIAEVMGEREITVTRELTKLHEECLSGTAADLAAQFGDRASIKGEITLLISPPDRDQHEDLSEEALDAELACALKTMSPSRAAAHVAETLRLPRKRVYARAMALRDGDGGPHQE
ncbi:16S rRNA (cytidine(1402)-2'-O)-methyltransferase [Rhodoligotrophos ferricapiens]|uniref:16S rRNA (cytidine(1402)-2'-O)-methyltransferase n=1 Tax=Rhodoligotrophos ferricapiens TaxID=3069264 RepID=UPI00315C71D7